MPEPDSEPDPAHERSWLRRRARRLLSDGLRRHVDSGDLAQAAQLEALRAARHERFASRGALRAWLARALDNLVRHEGRRLRPGAAGDSTWGRLAAGGSSPSSIAARREAGEVVSARMASLSPRQRQVLELRLWEELPFAGVGARLGVSEGNARVLFHRAITRLRRDLAPADE